MANVEFDILAVTIDGRRRIIEAVSRLRRARAEIPTGAWIASSSATPRNDSLAA